jgi:protein-S-isoprenylcysteine O-methyltransferase Ste14
MTAMHMPELHDDEGTHRHARLDTARSAFWAAVGSAVILFIFFAALGSFDPGEARALTVVIAVLAVAWLAHAWRRVLREQVAERDQSDRERRGF